MPPHTAPFRPAPLRPVVARVSLLTLARFRRLMAREGWPVDLPRMCLDRLYACERMALAHGSAEPRLRALALALFAAYEDGPVPRTLH